MQNVAKFTLLITSMTPGRWLCEAWNMATRDSTLQLGSRAFAVNIDKDNVFLGGTDWWSGALQACC